MLHVKLPGGNGIKAIPTLPDTPPPPEVIIITGSGDPDGAELSIQWGAWDYIEKPSTVEAMTLPLIRALEFRKEKTDKKELITLDRNGIIGSKNQPFVIEAVAPGPEQDLPPLDQPALFKYRRACRRFQVLADIRR